MLGYANLTYVNSRGLIELCDCYPESARRDIFKSDTKGQLDFSRCNSVPEGSLVYVVSSELRWFEQQSFLPHLQFNSKFILVTGSSVFGPLESMGNRTRLLNMLNSDAISRWYAQNLDFEHPKLYPIPLGIDYHSAYDQQYVHPFVQERLLLNSKRQLPHLLARPHKALSDIHHKYYGRADALVRIGHASHGGRELCVRGVNRSEVDWLPRMSRQNLWKAHSRGRFLLSPTGIGQDCHRTYEALALGTIPIVPESVLSNSSIFDGLCVGIVSEWSGVGLKDVSHLLQAYTSGRCVLDTEKMLMSYWKNEFTRARALLHPR